MDPSAQELAAFANLGDVVAWIGLQDIVLAALRDAIGDFQLLREVVLIPRTAWDDEVAAARIQPPGDGPPPARALRPLELGQVESLRRIARLRLGLPAAEERAAGSPMAVPSAGGGGGTPLEATGPGGAGGAGAPAVAAGTAGTVALTRKFKMSSVFDQGDDTEISTWTAARMRTVMAAFKAANDGEEPEQDEEVTADQLAALEHRLNSGACPCPGLRSVAPVRPPACPATQAHGASHHAWSGLRAVRGGGPSELQRMVGGLQGVLGGNARS